MAQAADDARARVRERADGTRVSSAQRRAAAERRAAGAVVEPDPLDASTVEVLPGPAPVGVPNFFIDRFRIPPFLLPIYQAAGIQYGVRWEVLAAINEIETDYGRNLNVSSAGALGWMQFMSATWKAYGVDANGDGEKDPYNPVDAIFAAARYLRAAGAEKDLRKAIFAYNHADWYVDSVLLRARLVGGLPPDLVGSLTGLTQGVFPVAAKARYAGEDADAVTKLKKVAKRGNAAKTVDAERGRDSLAIFSRNGAAAIAAQDGEVVKVDKSAGKITVKHGPIKNLDMDSMTMVFRVADPAMLDKVGFVPEANLIGPAKILFWSYDGSFRWYNPLTWVTALRWQRLLNFIG